MPESRWLDLDRKIVYRDTDILVVSYPKCGTTWIEQCVLMLLHDADASKMNPAFKNVYIPGTADIGTCRDRVVYSHIIQ